MDGRLVVLGKGTIRAACSRVNGSRLRFAVFFLVAVCLALVEVAHGEMRLTMVESIAKALSRNTQVRSSAFGVKKASWERRRAWASLFPTLTLNSRVTRIDERTFAERDFTRYLPPELASQIPRTVFRTSYSTRDLIVFQVVRIYVGVLKSKEVLNLQKDYLGLSRLNYEKAQRLQRADRYSQSDVSRWKVDHQQQKSIVVASESALRSSSAALKRLLNLNMGVAVELEGRVPEGLIGESGRLAGLSDSEVLRLIRLGDGALIQTNAALSAAKAHEEQIRRLHRGSYASYMPSLSLSYSHSWRENNTLALDDYSPKTLMVFLSMPLFSGFQSYASTKSAYYDYRRTQKEFTNQLHNTRFILTETANTLVNLKTQRVLSKANVEFSDQNYRVVERQRERGVASSIQFIDTKLSLQNAKFNEITVHYDFISDMVELYYLLGKLSSVVDY